MFYIVGNGHRRDVRVCGYEGFENEAALTFDDNLDIDVCARGMNATALLMKSNSSSVVAAMARVGLRVILTLK